MCATRSSDKFYTRMSAEAAESSMTVNGQGMEVFRHDRRCYSGARQCEVSMVSSTTQKLSPGQRCLVVETWAALGGVDFP